MKIPTYLKPQPSSFYAWMMKTGLGQIPSRERVYIFQQTGKRKSSTQTCLFWGDMWSFPGGYLRIISPIKNIKKCLEERQKFLFPKPWWIWWIPWWKVFTNHNNLGRYWLQQNNNLHNLYIPSSIFFRWSHVTPMAGNGKFPWNEKEIYISWKKLLHFPASHPGLLEG